MKNGFNINQYGTKEWWSNDKLHREDGPALENKIGTKGWYINGRLHREDGPAIERANGDKEWYLNGKRHREDGPAVERGGRSRFWFLNDERLEIIPQYVLFNYMKANNLTLAHLLTDPDPLVRKSVEEYKWKEVV
jgi:hypothetical protein